MDWNLEGKNGNLYVFLSLSDSLSASWALGFSLQEFSLSSFPLPAPQLKVFPFLHPISLLSKTSSLLVQRHTVVLYLNLLKKQRTDFIQVCV